MRWDFAHFSLLRMWRMIDVYHLGVVLVVRR